MKNITVSVDDELYRQSRIKSAELGTSVTGLVREFLTRISDRHIEATDTTSDCVLAIIDEMRERHSNFSLSNPLTREEIHSRP